MALKRYLFFSHSEYYPSGGLGDCRDFETLEEAMKVVDATYSDSKYILDRITGEIVFDIDNPQPTTHNR